MFKQIFYSMYIRLYNWRNKVYYCELSGNGKRCCLCGDSLIVPTRISDTFEEDDHSPVWMRMHSFCSDHYKDYGNGVDHPMTPKEQIRHRLVEKVS